MVSQSEMQTAMINRSIRTIKAELEFLCDASVITPATLNTLLASIPEQTALRAPISVGAVPSALPTVQPPTAALNNTHLNNNNSNGNGVHTPYNEKTDSFYQPPAAQPPPAYNNSPPAANYPPLATAVALYAYSGTDAGDLSLQPGDQIHVTQYMNAEWWKGKSVRTSQEGIFPRSYVRVEENKSPAGNNTGNNYGNEPLAVSGMGNGEGKAPSKLEENGKKFGKKLGNAAIFGAGATIGGNIVNSIF